tara:strand:- start:1090 stop:2202 length:1113 start_codon:yes stop_codon:yes gene_type:complete
MKILNFKNKIIYIAEFSLPNMSAYAVHVLKMCDSFSDTNEVELIIPFKDNKYSFEKIKKSYNLKNRFIIKSIFSSKSKLNLFHRIIFALKTKNYVKNIQYKMILSRSIISSLLLSYLNFKNILEIHTELTGVTKQIFNLRNQKNIYKNLKYIVLHSELIKILKLNRDKTIVIEDAVESEDFTTNNSKKIIYACAYSGSFAAGKGIEFIHSLAKKIPEVTFHAYGNINTLDKNFNKIDIPKNFHFMGFVSYAKVTKILPQYKILLMPYQNKVGVLIKGIDVSKYFSPLKLFEYMASGRPIIASNLKVYRNILKHNYNSILLKQNNITGWTKAIKKIMSTNQFSYLGKNAKKSVKKYSWKLRTLKIIEFYEK